MYQITVHYPGPIGSKDDEGVSGKSVCSMKSDFKKNTNINTYRK